MHHCSSHSPSLSCNPIQELRSFLQQNNLEGFLIPRTDEFLNEFIPSYAERLAWLTGFTGSAGLALLTLSRVILFVDGRYTLQAAQEVNTDLVEIQPWTFENVSQSLKDCFSKGASLGYDPWLHSFAEQERYEKIAESYGFAFLPLDKNPIDFLWRDQPALPQEPIVPHPLVYAGSSFQEKHKAICTAQPDVDLWLLTDAPSLAWLLNIRGADVPYTPIPQAYGLLSRQGTCDLFIDPAKVSQEVKEALGGAVSFIPLQDFSCHLRAQAKGKKVTVDPQQTPAAFRPFLAEATVSLRDNPCVFLKSLKNSSELNGIKNAHVMDGVAVVRFLYWLAHIPLDGSESEISAAEKLEIFRRSSADYRGPSFSTIAAYGANGAIVHYRPLPEKPCLLKKGGLFLVDSGGQYVCGGTTDITRTIALGLPTAEQKEVYTRVLKGHIALSQAVFPAGTYGHQLDVLARLPLWEKGYDFAHGTGHGVGSYLAVHEGPQSISKKTQSASLQPGMVLSNEPGYYKAGAYGIRLENLVFVVEKKESPLMLGFETLTLAPFDLQLVDETLLSPIEKNWLKTYHQQVIHILSPHLEHSVSKWLEKNCFKE